MAYYCFILFHLSGLVSSEKLCLFQTDLLKPLHCKTNLILRKLEEVVESEEFFVQMINQLSRLASCNIANIFLVPYISLLFQSP